MSESMAASLSPESIMGTVAGFQQARVLLSAAQLDVFTHLAGGRKSAAELAHALHADTRALTYLLDALAGIGLLHKDAAGYWNAPAALGLLVRGAPGSVLAALEHFAHVWDRWSTLTTVVRTGRPVDFQEVNDRGTDELESFLGAMDVIARGSAAQVAQAVGLTGVRRMLDVGGGAASYVVAFAQAEPTLTGVVLDLPNVVPIARRGIERAGIQDRLTTLTGDYRTGTFPTGFDMVLLSAIVHINSPEENAYLVRRCASSLAPAGRLVIRDFIMAPERTQPVGGALFAINMLVGTQGGGTFTEAEMRAWMEGAGLTDVHTVDLPGMNALMIGSKA